MDIDAQVRQPYTRYYWWWKVVNSPSRRLCLKYIYLSGQTDEDAVRNPFVCLAKLAKWLFGSRHKHDVYCGYVVKTKSDSVDYWQNIAWIDYRYWFFILYSVLSVVCLWDGIAPSSNVLSPSLSYFWFPLVLLLFSLRLSKLVNVFCKLLIIANKQIICPQLSRSMRRKKSRVTFTIPWQND